MHVLVRYALAYISSIDDDNPMEGTLKLASLLTALDAPDGETAEQCRVRNRKNIFGVMRFIGTPEDIINDLEQRVVAENGEMYASCDYCDKELPFDTTTHACPICPMRYVVCDDCACTRAAADRKWCFMHTGAERFYDEHSLWTLLYVLRDYIANGPSPILTEIGDTESTSV